MQENNYIVQFIRNDHQPNEEYVYANRLDAEHHFSLFQNDNSGLYKKINLLSWIGTNTKILKFIEF